MWNAIKRFLGWTPVVPPDSNLLMTDLMGSVSELEKQIEENHGYYLDAALPEPLTWDFGNGPEPIFCEAECPTRIRSIGIA
jgi:hypothetical protein